MATRSRRGRSVVQHESAPTPPAAFQGRICELANGTVVAPAALVRWLESAWLERVVFDSPSRVLDVGVAQRLFTGATRRAVEVRDRECFHTSRTVAMGSRLLAPRSPP